MYDNVLIFSINPSVKKQDTLRCCRSKNTNKKNLQQLAMATCRMSVISPTKTHRELKVSDWVPNFFFEKILKYFF